MHKYSATLNGDEKFISLTPQGEKFNLIRAMLDESEEWNWHKQQKQLTIEQLGNWFRRLSVDKSKNNDLIISTARLQKGSSTTTPLIT